MKNRMILALTLVVAVSGFALIFCRKEDPASPTLMASKAKAAGTGPLAGKSASADKPAKRKAKPASRPPAPAPLTPEQEAAEKARLERIALAKASYVEAVAANDKVAIASRDFLANNGQREGVVTTVSDLQYEIVTAGTGPSPAATDTVKVHYHGTLPDGTVFDSSVERGEPVSFPLSAVIAGWTEGVQLMPAGSKYKLFIPSYLAYGDRGAGPKIPANSALIFEVELLAIEQK